MHDYLNWSSQTVNHSGYIKVYFAIGWNVKDVIIIFQETEDINQTKIGAFTNSFSPSINNLHFLHK